MAWLKENTGWQPFTYEAQILRDHMIRTRYVKKSRQIGITTTISKEAGWKAGTSDHRLILIVSPSFRQSQQPMNMIHATVDTTPKLYEQVTAKSRSEIAFKNGSRILSLPNNPDRLRVFSANDIYLDEAAFFENDEAVMRAIAPMVTATKGTLTVISTPAGKQGMFYRQWLHACEVEDTDPTIKTYDLCPSSISPLIGEEGLEREKNSGLYTEIEFEQEMLGIFIEEVDVYYPMDYIMACVNGELEPIKEPEAGKKFYWGVDFAKKRDETAVFILEKIKRPDGSTKLKARLWFTWARMEYSDQIGRLGQLKKLLPCAKGIVDQTGVGEAVIEDVVRVIPSAEGLIFTQKSKLELAGRLRLWMESTKKKKEQPDLIMNELELPNDRKMITQMNAIRYEVSKGGNILFKEEAKERLHPDYPWAVAMAVAAASEPELVVQDLYGAPPPPS